MSYGQALEKAWNEISGLTGDKRYPVKFLDDTYDIDLIDRRVTSLSCNVPARDHIAILILHYLIKRLKEKVLSEPTGEWISFKQLLGGDGYYPAFKKRTIDVILRKYGLRPETLLDLTQRFCAKRVQVGDFGIVLEPLEKVPILIAMWKKDEEFGPSINISFDASIPKILSTEDIVILTEFIAHSL